MQEMQTCRGVSKKHNVHGCLFAFVPRLLTLCFISSDYSQLEQQGVTPSETFWCSPHANATNRSLTIPPLLNQIFPEGLKPLGDKVEELVIRTARKTQGVIAANASVASSPKSPSKRFTQSPSSETAGLENAAQRLERMLRLSQITSTAMNSAPNSPTIPSKRQSLHHGAEKNAAPTQDDEKGSVSRSRLSIAVPASPFADFSISDRHLHSAADVLRSSRSRTEESQPFPITPGSGGSFKGARIASARTRGTALTAAGIIWDKQQPNAVTPLQRQCLTFEEMCSLRKKQETDAAREAEAAKRSAMMSNIANPSFPRKSSTALSSGTLLSPSRMGSFTRTPSVRTSSPVKKFEPDISRLSSQAMASNAHHLHTRWSVGPTSFSVAAEASRSSELFAVDSQ